MIAFAASSGLVVVVVDLQEDPEPLLPGQQPALRGRDALQVGGVAVVPRVQLAGDLDLVDQRPHVQVGGVGAGLAGVGAGRDPRVGVSAPGQQPITATRPSAARAALRARCRMRGGSLATGNGHPLPAPLALLEDPPQALQRRGRSCV